MMDLQATATQASVPASFTNGATASFIIDTAMVSAGGGGPCEELKIVASLGPPNTATNVPSVFQLLVADVTSATSFVAISGSSMTSQCTSMNTVTNATYNANLYEWDVDLRGSPGRYIEVQISPVTTQVIAIQADCGRLHMPPVDSTVAKNVSGLIVLVA